MKKVLREIEEGTSLVFETNGSARLKQARIIAEAAANRWDKLNDTAGVQWLSEAISQAIAQEAQPADISTLCYCKIGQCHFLTERCREMQR